MSNNATYFCLFVVYFCFPQNHNINFILKQNKMFQAIIEVIRGVKDIIEVKDRVWFYFYALTNCVCVCARAGRYIISRRKHGEMVCLVSLTIQVDLR